MKFYLDISDLTYKFVELEPEVTLVILDKDGKLVRPTTWDEWYELAIKYPDQVEIQGYSLGSILLMKKKN